MLPKTLKRRGRKELPPRAAEDLGMQALSATSAAALRELGDLGFVPPAPHTPTGNGFVWLSLLNAKLEKRPCSSDIKPVYQ